MNSQKLIANVFNAKTWQKKRKQDLSDSLKKYELELNKKLASKTRLRKLENVLNEDCSGLPEKKRQKTIKLEATEDGKGNSLIFANLKKELCTPVKVQVGKKKYTRSCTQGSIGAETLVRRNIEKLILEAKEIGKLALKEKNNEPLINLCLEPMSGFYRADFEDTLGNSMKGEGRAVQELIKQFFKDSPMMEKLKVDIISEFYSEKRIAK